MLIYLLFFIDYVPHVIRNEAIMMIQTIVLNSKTNRKLIIELGNAITKSNALEKELSMLKIIPKNKKLSHPTRKSSALLLALFSSLKNDSIETGDIFLHFYF